MIQSGLLWPLHFRFVLLALFPLEQSFLRHGEHLPHGIVESLEVCLAGNLSPTVGVSYSDYYSAISSRPLHTFQCSRNRTSILLPSLDLTFNRHRSTYAILECVSGFVGAALFATLGKLFVQSKRYDNHTI